MLGVTRANYLRELWARYYDPAWAGSNPSLQDDRAAEAFAAAVWEILYEDLPTTPMGWDVTVDGTENPVGGFWAEDLDAATANKWLHSLTGGPKADLRVFSVDGAQNYLVAVPEPATLVLLGLGGLCSFLGRRRA
ncbi:MAG: hypothetical protein A2Y76_03495 [Planctomycetes bacterium RBG_13_60_9]|nr:MAG: hypothetical protein A2Y76_03495 [Planctomycetes bacterium RBG_13_60_9]